MVKSKQSRRSLPWSRRRLWKWVVILLQVGAVATILAASWAGLPTSMSEAWNRLHSAWIILRANL